MDIGTPGLLRERTGHWLRVRVIGLLSEPRTRLFRAFRARDEQHTRAQAADETSFDDY